MTNLPVVCPPLPPEISCHAMPPEAELLRVIVGSVLETERSPAKVAASVETARVRAVVPDTFSTRFSEVTELSVLDVIPPEAVKRPETVRAVGTEKLMVAIDNQAVKLSSVRPLFSANDCPERFSVVVYRRSLN